MPTWCCYCHKEKRTKFERVESKAHIICYNCHKNGHKSFDCPRRNVTSDVYKKNRISYQTEQIPSIDVIDQNTTVQDTEKDPNDSDHNDEEMIDVSEESDKEDELEIDFDEILNLKKISSSSYPSEYWTTYRL
jgi:hypothetical protein